MKKNLKKITQFIAVCALLVLSSCEKDFNEEALPNSQFKVSHKKYEDIIQEEKFNKALAKVNEVKSKASSSTNRTVMEEQYGFTITDMPVNVIENDTVTSYTLFITRDDNPANVIENLIVQVNNQNEIDAYILKYTSNENFYENYNMVDFQGTKSILPIVYNANETDENGKLMYYESCRDIRSWICYGPGHHSNSDGCTMGFSITEQVCTTLSYDDGSGGGGGGGGGAGIANGNNNTGGIADVFTVPHTGHTNLNGDTPCKKLKNRSNNTIFRQKFKDLNSNTRFNTNGETAYFETIDANNVKSFVFKQPYAGTHVVTIPSGTFSYMHVHNNENEDEDENGVRINITVKMFSPYDDLNALLGGCQSTAIAHGISKGDVYGLMISSEGIFAMNFLDDEYLENLSDEQYAKFQDEYVKETKEIYKNYPSNSTAHKISRKYALQKLFLSLLKTHGLQDKVGLYEGTVVPPTAGQTLPTIYWKRKTLDENGELTETPC